MSIDDFRLSKLTEPIPLPPTRFLDNIEHFPLYVHLQNIGAVIVPKRTRLIWDNNHIVMVVSEDIPLAFSFTKDYMSYETTRILPSAAQMSFDLDQEVEMICTCGSHKTYGKENSMHSDWCDMNRVVSNGI